MYIGNQVPRGRNGHFASTLSLPPEFLLLSNDNLADSFQKVRSLDEIKRGLELFHDTRTAAGAVQRALRTHAETETKGVDIQRGIALGYLMIEESAPSGEYRVRDYSTRSVSYVCAYEPAMDDLAFIRAAVVHPENNTGGPEQMQDELVAHVLRASGLGITADFALENMRGPGLEDGTSAPEAKYGMALVALAAGMYRQPTNV